jgi:transcription antitermination factor NusG
VLRTSGRFTLRLAKSLTAAGLQVWTPIEQKVIRVPRANVRRSIVLPLMPSYVFADAAHLVELIQINERKKRLEVDVPDFSLMRLGDRIPLIEDELLNGLRTIEQKRAPKKRAPKLPVGLKVRVGEAGGSFAGMKGRVEQSGEQYTLVCFDNRMTVKISTYLLCENELSSDQPAALQRAA